jgi:hypothetical protein
MMMREPINLIVRNREYAWSDYASVTASKPDSDGRVSIYDLYLSTIFFLLFTYYKLCTVFDTRSQ